MSRLESDTESGDTDILPGVVDVVVVVIAVATAAAAAVVDFDDPVSVVS